jgi:hypothetical protein
MTHFFKRYFMFLMNSDKKKDTVICIKDIKVPNLFINLLNISKF